MGVVNPGYSLGQVGVKCCILQEDADVAVVIEGDVDLSCWAKVYNLVMCGSSLAFGPQEVYVPMGLLIS